MPTMVKVLGGYLEIDIGGTGGGGPVDPGYGAGWNPPTWGGGGQPQPGHHPSHPIAPGGRPPGIWGGPPNYPDQGLPGPQPTPGWPPVAMPPIYYPGAPGRPPGVISGGPGSLPPWVMPPIAPGGQPGGQPPGIWGGKPPEWVDNTLPPDQPVAGWPPTIMPPIFYPPDVPPVEEPPEGPVEWHTGWTPEKGWVVVGIITPDAPVPTPSQPAPPPKK
jgi:hypothetical protein